MYCHNMLEGRDLTTILSVFADYDPAGRGGSLGGVLALAVKLASNGSVPWGPTAIL